MNCRILAVKACIIVLVYTNTTDYYVNRLYHLTLLLDYDLFWFRIEKCADANPTYRILVLSPINWEVEMGISYAIIGSGSLGTANSQARGGKEEIDDVVIYSRNKKITEQIKKSHQNKVYFPGIPLHPKVRAENIDYEKINEADVIEIDTLTNALNDVGEGIKNHYRNQPVIFTCKGMVNRNGSPMFPHEALRDILGENAPIVFLYNNAFARAIIKEDVTFNSIACEDIKLAEEIASLIRTRHYRIIENSGDVIGLEIMAIMKNIVAIAMGMAESLGISRSSQCGILYEGRREMMALGKKLGAEEKTFFGISLEDFWLSGLGKESRNWQFGNQFSRNKQRGRFNPRRQISAVSAKLRRRKHRNVLDDLRDLYEGIIVTGVADGIHDALDSPFILGRRVRDTIFNTISRVPFPEASEGTFTVPSLLQRARAEGMNVPIVEGLHEVLFGGASGKETMRHMLEVVQSDGIREG